MLEVFRIKAWSQAIQVRVCNTTGGKDTSPPLMDGLLHLIDDLARSGTVELELACAIHQIFPRRKPTVSSNVHRLALLASSLATRDQVECWCQAKVASSRHECMIALMVIRDRDKAVEGHAPEQLSPVVRHLDAPSSQLSCQAHIAACVVRPSVGFVSTEDRRSAGRAMFHDSTAYDFAVESSNHQ